MLFNSLEFIIFFPIVSIIYFLLPHKSRWFLLLISSCVFYAAAIPKYLFVLWGLITIDYFAAILIDRNQGWKRKFFLLVSILSTCTALVAFKYCDFFNSNITVFAHLVGWNYSLEALKLILPIGLSFHTFQSLSYIIEVYSKRQKIERNFGIYALYVMFYPQLVAGPIERPQNLLHQFREPHYFEYQRVVDGLKLMAWGMFKKVVIADRLAGLVNQVYGRPQDYPALPLMAATVFFAFQIYCDFSGYTDMAIGSAQVMGFRLMDNFNRPYFSKSIAEFWKRWHISLSSWFRDYVYIPLGGNRVPWARWYFNLFATFLLSGLWHGANWTYIFWGALNGFYMVFSVLTTGFRNAIVGFIRLKQHPFIHKCLKIMITFVLVCFGWIFFRARNMDDAWYIVKTIFITAIFLLHGLVTFNLGALKELILLEVYGSGFFRSNYYDLRIAIVTIIFLLFVHGVQRHKNIRHMLGDAPVYLRWFFYEVLIFSILILGVFNKMQFIYFQF